MKMATSQQYCLRWNNHRSNLLTVFDQLLQNEAFTDVTLACDGGAPVKCHKMVLAACSPYFQYLFTDLPCRHPVVVLKDVKYADMKAILEYMYRGEVNVAHDQLAALLKVAEALRVKGLVEENGNGVGKPEPDQPDHHHRLDDSSSPPRIGTSTASIASVPHSSVSPPHSTHGNGSGSGPHSPGYNKPYMYNKNNDHRRINNVPMWGVQQTAPSHAAATAAAAMLSSCYDSVSPDMSPLRRKKLQSLLMSRDTPILRTVLGQGQPDSSHPVPLICHPDTQERVHFNGNISANDRNVKAEPSEDAQSPYTDISMMDEENSPIEKSNKSVPSSSPQTDMRIANYVPQQKPEWKRYKQYTRNDIMNAIEAVKTGMSALQAARKYGVPSRTLYDKVKKMGIQTSRPFKRGTNGSSTPAFPYSINSMSNMFGCKSEPDESSLPPHPSSSLLEPMFLQHALERGKPGDYPDREALMALATAHAQAAAHGGGTGGGSQHNSSPEYKWAGSGSMTPSPNDVQDMDDDDRVEDLSVGRKEPVQHHTGSVIVPPMSHLNIKTEEERIRHREEELERERERECERERDRERERERDRERERECERERAREEERARLREQEQQDQPDQQDHVLQDRRSPLEASPLHLPRRD